MTQFEVLYRLQEIDLGIHARQKRLEEIAQLLTNDSAVVEAQRRVTDINQVLTPLQTKSRNLELEIQTNASKIKITDETLYSGRVRNPKELQDMQHEIASLKKRNLELEDILLETMLLVESTQAELKQLDSDLQRIKEEREVANKHLVEERTRIRSEGSALVKNRETLVTEIDPEHLKLYTSLKPRKNNQPVALLANQSCTACRVQQDLSIINEVRKGQRIVYCSSCGRILAYGSG
jgi:uncharacterized protein